jgi:hypothetical protein
MFLYLIKHYAMKACWGIEAYLHLFLTPALDGVNGQFHDQVTLLPVQELPLPSNTGLGGPRAGLNVLEKR